MAVKTTHAVLSGLALVGIAFWQFSVAAGLRRENITLSQKLNDKEVRDLDAAKHGCAERTQKYFATLGYSEVGSNDNMTATFQNHYSHRLDRCLMLLQTGSFINGKQINSENLIDVDERKNFGEYGWVSSETTKYWDQKPMSCTMSPPDKAQSICHSADEWNAYTQGMLSS